jgi:hypothetical protein
MRALSTIFFASLLPLACSAASDPGTTAHDPQTLEQAEAQLDALDARLAVAPNDPAALVALEALRATLDELNGMVAKVEIARGHSVTFYDHETSIGIVERRPAGAGSAVADVDPNALRATEVFEFLAPDAEIPEALRDAERRVVEVSKSVADVEAIEDGSGGGAELSDTARQSGNGVAVVQQALTAADGPWFRDNLCWPDGAGSFEMCLPNHGGGAWVQGYYKHSEVRLAPFSGNVVSLRRIWNGSLQSVYAVYPGELVYYWQSGPPTCDRPLGIFACATDDYKKGTHRWEVSNASGDGFHFASRMRN